jgi:4-hydroxybenzoate polyprenyltransferase
MGLPERLVDRQLDRARGSRRARLQALRATQNLLLASVILGLLTALISSVSGVFDRRVWVAFALVWLAVGYVNWRQRRYLRRLSAERQ